MKYPGAELDNFDKATIWRKYIFFEIKRFIKGKVLEVGAGIGSFTKNYMDLTDNIVLSEVDPTNYQIIKDKFKNKNFVITNKITKELDGNFNTIMYLNVLEHIKDDKKEIEDAFQKLNKEGYLIILVPAHNKLYSKFDEAVGHFKRYELEFFKNINFKDWKVEKIIF